MPCKETHARIERYLKEARLAILNGQADDALFVTARGGPMTRQMFWTLVRKHAKVAGINASFTLRHAFSPYLPNHGADPRVVQLLLGYISCMRSTIRTVR